MIKALFFDIDGTLVSFKTHTIPASTIEAINAAKQKGVKIFIATGRCRRFINNLKSIEHLIDGYMTANGGYCYIGQRDVCLHTIDRDDVEKIMDYCDRKHTSCIVVGTSKVSGIHLEKAEHMFGPLLQESIEQWKSPLEEVLEQDIIQLTPFLTTDEEAELMPQLHSVVSARWYPTFSDMTGLGADKGQGLVAMARAEGFDVSETMAFGDGGNDVPIIREAGIGVVMGNAMDDVKAEADYVTSSVDDDGIKLALQHFGVI